MASLWTLTQAQRAAVVKELMEMGLQTGEVNRMAFFKKKPRDTTGNKRPNIVLCQLVPKKCSKFLLKTVKLEKHSLIKGSVPKEAGYALLSC